MLIIIIHYNTGGGEGGGGCKMTIKPYLYHVILLFIALIICRYMYTDITVIITYIHCT